MAQQQQGKDQRGPGAAARRRDVDDAAGARDHASRKGGAGALAIARESGAESEREHVEIWSLRAFEI
jgi:hypothetical protein